MRNFDLKVRVVAVNGFCPTYRIGDEFRISAGYVLEGRDTYCMHSLAALLPFYLAMSRGVTPAELGFCKEGENAAYIQCPDPQRATGGGTVVFEITRTEGPWEQLPSEG